MWKRLPLRDRGKENSGSVQISAPTLVESTYDHGQLEQATDIQNGVGGDYRVRPAVGRQNTDETVIASQELQPPREINSNHFSVAASSIYSQPSPDMNYNYNDQQSYPQYYDEVSPPSSPVGQSADYGGGVSPVEEYPPSMNGQVKPNNRQGSQIPVPRKPSAGMASPDQAKRAPPAKAWTQNVGKSPMMWDKYSGEPTLTGTGVPAQVKPGSGFNLRSQLRSTNKAYQPPSDPEATHKTTFREKASKFKQGLTINTDTRPPWKGSSGRQAIVPPPEDKPGQPTPVPARNSDRIKSPVRSPQSSSPKAIVRKAAPNSETARVATPENVEVQEERTIPHQPLPTGRSSPRQVLASQASREIKQTGYPSPVSPTDPGPTPTQEKQEQYYPSTSSNPGDIILPKRQSRRSTEKGSVSEHSSQQDPNLTSRFSWTTTATSTTYQHSPPPSPPPPVPAMYVNNGGPAAVSSATVRVSPDAAPTVLNRGHPTRRLGDLSAGPPSPTFSYRSMSSTIRKPVAIQEPIHSSPLPDWRNGSTVKVHSYHRAPSVAPSTTSTNADKALPKTPHELSSVDTITSLQAQQDDLFNQRSNLQRLIRDAQKPEPQNPLVSDIRSRREMEKRIISLKEDLSEVARLEYDVGLRLHRAWKRREREDPSSGVSVLWVRRVTNGV